ncbi:longitudinals lacking protein, isoforms F/I/K/T-like isoform X2 [Euwallacea fornicatus]|uniref:longitudinals lacking protein, isoforms F/I/K/T-like isoform X2 n=1 Tax=Euwallacea fornicatus TaxID=995702 RepID=UPI00338E5C81
MDDDQQFCLRWNNHQSTLVAVFDTLLENEKLVDCTLAAEGKFLNAHKVVLSACSPYFESLLSRHYDKHPILILKDVKFQELKAMMDYMYRGEVNISQDQLGALLKAAESLQIKGLSDNKKEEPAAKRAAPAAAPPKSPQTQSAIPKVQGLTIEQRSRDEREGSISPGPRKKKRMRRKSEEMDNHHDASNSSDAPQNIPSATTQLPVNIKMNNDVPDTIETKQEILRHKDESGSQLSQVPMIKEKLETHTELMLEPKSEYADDMNEDSIEDLTLDDDDLSNMEQQMDDGAGPSHGGEGSSQQGFGHWQMGNQSQDEVFLAAQEAVGAHRDSQGCNEPQEPATQNKDASEVVESDNTCVSDNIDPNKISYFNQALDLTAVSHVEELDSEEMMDMSELESIMAQEGQNQELLESDIVCEICNTGFRHMSSLRYHRKHRVCLKPKREEMEPKVHQCEKCEKVFATGSGYKYHVRRSVCEQEEERDGPRIFQCPLCLKVFATNTGLTYHTKRKVCEQVQEEKEEEVIQCDKCETSFRHRTSLQYHLSHNVCTKPKKEEAEPKPLKCEQCEKIFSTTTALGYHVKHNVCAPKEPKEPKAEEQRECHLCNATFKHYNSLRYHLTHQVCVRAAQMEKPEPKVLQCEKCEKVFTSNSSLEYHVKRKVCEQVKQVVPGPPYICDICDTSFELRQTWYAHVQRQACKKYPERYMTHDSTNLEVSVKIETE